MADLHELKKGDRVFAEFSTGSGATSGSVTRHAGPIVELTDTHARVQCAGYLVWIERGVLKPAG